MNCLLFEIKKELENLDISLGIETLPEILPQLYI